MDAEFDVRRAEVTFRNDAYGKLSLGKGSDAADDTAEYDLTLVSGPIMYAGVSDIAGGIFFTDGEALSTVTVGGALFDFDGGLVERVRYDSPMFGPVQASFSYAADEQWAGALTLGGDYGDWTGVEFGPFTALAAMSVADPAIDGVDYRLAGSASFLHNPSGLSLTLSAGTDRLDTGDDPYNLYGKIAYDTPADRQFFAVGPTGFGIDYTYSENISGEGDEGTSFGLAGVQRIEQYGVDLYAQLRWYSLDSATAPDLENVVVGTGGMKLSF